MLETDACIAKFGVSTAENGPSKVWVTHTPGQSTLTGSDFAPSTIRKAELSDCTDDSPELSPAPPSDDGTGAQTREPPTTVEDATTYPRPPDRPPLRVE